LISAGEMRHAPAARLERGELEAALAREREAHAHALQQQRIAALADGHLADLERGLEPGERDAAAVEVRRQRAGLAAQGVQHQAAQDPGLLGHHQEQHAQEGQPAETQGDAEQQASGESQRRAHGLTRPDAAALRGPGERESS
jgi:hypothetical protein